MFAGLEECREENMNRFMKGLNSEIRTLLVGKSYNNIASLFWLAVSVEKEILLSADTCKKDEDHNVENLSPINAIQEQEIVEPITDFGL
jgi:hypothetical protein